MRRAAPKTSSKVEGAGTALSPHGGRRDCRSARGARSSPAPLPTEGSGDTPRKENPKLIRISAA
ncbi:MAG: hypothetical protein NZM15_09395 [Flavobacteriales bacterium]|nr:hypothetical protein [Flavobacteriales bacterium]MDW8432903.1 hypothetical protein [Flavobacteriales bacterium]